MEEDGETKKEEECEDCKGTGVVSVMGKVYPGEPHMAYVDEEVCHCSRIDDDDCGRESFDD